MVQGYLEIKTQFIADKQADRKYYHVGKKKDECLEWH